MSRLDLRQDKVYRRGVVLGLTIAEIMILLIFVLLMALAAALANREERIEILDEGGATELVEMLQEAYPEAETQEDYFKELERAIQTRAEVEQNGIEAGTETVLRDAAIGRETREAAEEAGAEDPEEFLSEAVANAGIEGPRDFPPFFNLSEAEGYTFESGSATLERGTQQRLRRHVIPALRDYLEEYPAFNVVEVIGHTDEVHMPGQSNLDGMLIPASRGFFPAGLLRFGDNAGLAMARAVSVARILRTDPRLRGVTILPMSGGQMIVPVDQLADGSANESDRTRRRIEIRLRRQSDRQAVLGPAE